MQTLSFRNILAATLMVAALGAAAYFVAGSFIVKHDTEENRQRAERFYEELKEKYRANDGYAFPMEYVYNQETNIGFFSGGGSIEENQCQERIIRDAWSNSEVTSVALCVGEMVTKERLDAWKEYWEKHAELF